MARCEDYPCCGHELGCCPDFDEAGNQLNVVCTCGAKLPLNNPSSICNSCLRSGDDGDDQYVYNPRFDSDDGDGRDSAGDYDPELNEDLDALEAAEGPTERFDESDIEARFE